MFKLEDKLAALDVREAAAMPGDGERDAVAALHWGSDEAERELFAASNRRELALWRDLLPAKRVLQRAGWGVWFVDAKGRFAGGRRTAWIAVGSKTVDVETFRLMAERERRLAAAETRAA
jgi:hypothetical protein